MKLKIFIDGASRGNPGPGSVGVVIQDARGKVVREFGKCLGFCTNNVAEYTAFLTALETAKNLKGTELSIYSDSQLLVRQFEGSYRIKKPELAQFMQKIRQWVRHFKKVSLTHIPREQNKSADHMANQALDGEKFSAQHSPQKANCSPASSEQQLLILV
ncbi:MAG: ribonuclease HI family protein [Elusimicrobia bacterium]|nr:ribonuclease HI family protein [Elusimicrobiota bacterium]